MDEKVKDIFNAVKSTATMVSEAAGRSAAIASKKTSVIVESAKINVQIFDLNAEISELYKDLGAMVYKAHRGSENDENELQAKLTAIDEKNAQIAELKERVYDIKQVKFCSECNIECGIDDNFCKNCGRSI